ncbi:hypothetical protein E2F43_07925 [Seongchinamella unica]|uniref:DUF4136 domain-containing protein n=1 Tax=Seongchinamella unica TaxID=2547392 RepID=A0A4R5LRF5_9GAMM|nr:hypothetical protein [Seongchinamella unica]TDG13458.1 hypothetical protein E2F43_07925 [Seongchinamella unica]
MTSPASEGVPIRATTVSLTFFLALLFGCSNSATVEKSWVNQEIHTRDLQGVLVLAMANNAEGRRAFEEEFTGALIKHGVHAVASYPLKGGTDITREDVITMAAEAEVDTVLITLFAGRDETAVLHPGRKYYAWAPIYGRDYYGSGRVYGVPYQVGQSADFWAEHKSVHLTAKLYEISSEKRLWQVNSGMEDGSDVAAMRSAFIASFMKDLADQGLVD